MREILFRGKRLSNGEWIEGGITSPHPVVRFVSIIEKPINPCPHPDYILKHRTFLVDPETIGQFTGLYDKNGKKIFEGDIVVCKKEINGNWVDYCVEIGFVEMKHGAFGLHREKGYYRPFKDWLEDYEYEVIGNIHDNPELLER